MINQKRIYKCVPNINTGKVDIIVSNEDGQVVHKSSFENLKNAKTYLDELEIELKSNKHIKVLKIDNFHFEYKRN